MKIDERGMAAAKRAHTTFLGSMNGPTITEAVVTAYLSAVEAAAPAAPEGVEPVGYVTRAAIDDFDLHDTEIREVFLYPKGSLRPVNEFPLYPASALSAQAAEIERLRQERAFWENRENEALIRAERAEAALAANARLEKADRVIERFYIDCEFDGHNGQLLSMAIVGEDGGELYVAISDAVASDPWVKENVIPLIPMESMVDARLNDVGSLLRFFLLGAERPLIIADSPVDIGRFCRVLSTGADGGWSSTDFARISFEVENVDIYPTDLQGAIQHNALWDARALRHRLTARYKAGE